MRQQSIAVLPTPMISTRSPIVSMCPKATDSSQSMPMWMRSVSWRPGSSSSLPLGAPEPTNTASKPPASSSSLMLSTGRVEPQRRRPCRGSCRSPRRARSAGRRNDGMLRAHQAAGLAVLLEDRDLVAERHQVVGDRERGRAGADAGDALAVLARGRLRQPVGDVALAGRRRRASGGRSRPACPRRGRGGRPARRAGRRRARGCRGTRSTRG